MVFTFTRPDLLTGNPDLQEHTGALAARIYELYTKTSAPHTATSANQGLWGKLTSRVSTPSDPIKNFFEKNTVELKAICAIGPDQNPFIYFRDEKGASLIECAIEADNRALLGGLVKYKVPVLPYALAYLTDPLNQVEGQARHRPLACRLDEKKLETYMTLIREANPSEVRPSLVQNNLVRKVYDVPALCYALNALTVTSDESQQNCLELIEYYLNQCAHHKLIDEINRQVAAVCKLECQSEDPRGVLTAYIRDNSRSLPPQARAETAMSSPAEALEMGEAEAKTAGSPVAEAVETDEAGAKTAKSSAAEAVETGEAGAKTWSMTPEEQERAFIQKVIRQTGDFLKKEPTSTLDPETLALDQEMNTSVLEDAIPADAAIWSHPYFICLNSDNPNLLILLMHYGISMTQETQAFFESQLLQSTPLTRGLIPHDQQTIEFIYLLHHVLAAPLCVDTDKIIKLKAHPMLNQIDAIASMIRLHESHHATKMGHGKCGLYAWIKINAFKKRVKLLTGRKDIDKKDLQHINQQLNRAITKHQTGHHRITSALAEALGETDIPAALASSGARTHGQAASSHHQGMEDVSAALAEALEETDGKTPGQKRSIYKKR